MLFVRRVSFLPYDIVCPIKIQKFLFNNLHDCVNIHHSVKRNESWKIKNQYLVINCLVQVYHTAGGHI
jgi:hypothetical protein